MLRYTAAYYIDWIYFVEKSNIKMIFSTFHWPMLLVHIMDNAHINFDNMRVLSVPTADQTEKLHIF